MLVRVLCFCHRWIDSHQASTFCLELVKVVCLSTMSHINALMIKAHQAFKTILKSKSYLETMQQSAFRPGFLPCMLMQVKKWLWRKEAISRQWNHKFLGRSQSIGNFGEWVGLGTSNLSFRMTRKSVGFFSRLKRGAGVDRWGVYCRTRNGTFHA